MINDADRNLAIDYALGLLTGDELIEFEARLHADGELRALVDEFRDTTSLLAYSAESINPPPALKDSILAAVRADHLAHTEQATPGTSVRRSQWLPWAAAAAFAIYAGLLWNNNRALLTDSRELATQKAISEDLFTQIAELQAANNTAAEARQALENELAALGTRIPDLERQVADLRERNALAEMKVATLTSQIDASYLASIAWDQDEQSGILHVRRLPETERGKDYQLWVLDKNQAAPVSAGIFRVEADGSATIQFAPTQPVSVDSSFAVSVEKSGGSLAPEGPIVLSN